MNINAIKIEIVIKKVRNCQLFDEKSSVLYFFKYFSRN